MSHAWNKTFGKIWWPVKCFDHQKKGNSVFFVPDSGCYLRFNSSWWCIVCPGHTLASRKELPLKDISPCGQKSNVDVDFFDVIHYFLSATCNWIKVPEPQKSFLNCERWDLKSPPPLAIWWLHFLTAVNACRINTRGHFWEIWFCAYQFHCCYCHSFGQDIMWEWTVRVWCLHVTHL